MQTLTNAHELVTKVGVTQRQVTVTPALAEQWLEVNTRNRKLKEDNLRTLTAQMLGDTFQSLNGQTIVFSQSGILLDGQHRLQAIINSGKTYEFVVVDGVSDEAFTTIDLGVKRKSRDVFQIEGIAYANGISAAVSFYLKFKNNVNSLSSGPIYRNITMEDTLEAYQQHSDLFQNLYEKSLIYNKKMKILTPSQITGLMAHTVLHSKFGSRCLNEFWTPLFTGVKASDQINLLRNKYIQTLGMSKAKSANIQHKIAWLVVSYNNHFNGKTQQRLVFQGPKLPEFM